MSARRPVAALTALCLLAGLAACGGGSSSEPGTTAQSSAPTSSSATASERRSPGSSSADATAGRSARASRNTRGGSAATSGGGPGSSPSSKKGAAGFVVPGGDNSIPNYGSESSSQEQAEATEALSAYLDARAAADWGGACAHLGAAVRSQVEILAAAAGGGERSKNCAASLAKIAEKAPEEEPENPFSGRLAAFRVKGERAFALFYGPHRQQYMMPMVSEGGGWKMGMFAPVPYPPGVPSRG